MKKKIRRQKVNDLFCSPDIIQMIKSERMRWAEHVALIGEKRDLYRVLVGKPERKRRLGSPRCSWKDNINLNLQEVRCGIMDWIRKGTGSGHL